MNQEQSCGKCIFWDRHEQNPNVGDCRRNPPQVVGIVQSAIAQKAGMGANKVLTSQQKDVVITKPQAVFPSMMRDDQGCGEFVSVDTMGQQEKQNPLKGTMYDAENQ